MLIGNAGKIEWTVLGYSDFNFNEQKRRMNEIYCITLVICGRHKMYMDLDQDFNLPMIHLSFLWLDVIKSFHCWSSLLQVSTLNALILCLNHHTTNSTATEKAVDFLVLRILSCYLRRVSEIDESYSSWTEWLRFSLGLRLVVYLCLLDLFRNMILKSALFIHSIRVYNVLCVVFPTSANPNWPLPRL